MDLFSNHNSQSDLKQDIPLVDGELALYPDLFSLSEANDYFKTLLDDTPWTQEEITMYGKTHNVPRLSAWYGDAEIPYTYSGITAYALPWTHSLQIIKDRIERVSHTKFNSVLVNLYRDGNDSVSWHADDELELGPQPEIASLSLGHARSFQLKHKTDKSQKHSLLLPHGSVLLMRGQTQKNWLHQIAKSRRPMGARINLTFRWVDAALAQRSAV